VELLLVALAVQEQLVLMGLLAIIHHLVHCFTDMLAVAALKAETERQVAAVAAAVVVHLLVAVQYQPQRVLADQHLQRLPVQLCMQQILEVLVQQVELPQLQVTQVI
jgi:hypothetical protein